MKPKSLDGLMEYMRDTKGISIEESQKRNLRNIGYYHGYKGYRYQGTAENILSYSDFDELMSVYNFDMELKTIVYPKIMFLEITKNKRKNLHNSLQFGNILNTNCGECLRTTLGETGCVRFLLIKTKKSLWPML